jgi:AcrR family transcriptional regulator
MVRLADPELAQRRRRQILEAAERCFRRRGFHQTSMQEICAESQISAGALYRYFGSKADIITAIAEYKHRESEAEFERVLGELGLMDALQSMFARFLTKIETESLGPVLADILGEAQRDPSLARSLAAIAARSLQRLSAAIAHAQQTGEIDAQLDPLEAAEMLGAAMEGLGLRFAMTRAAPATDLVRQFRTLAQRYLAPGR